ncbi:MAG: tRNA-dihydrouridine synthase family protein [Desulfamplus sp.]|nr:tRNA-dihydrouridine synthase family protein [Desulfamplus sp.]
MIADISKDFHIKSDDDSQKPDDAHRSCQKYLSSPVSIKGRQIKNRLFLAPMAGLGHVAFRELVSDFGGFGLLFTGMCSAKAVPQENRNISTVFKWRDDELPYLVCQIFGSDPTSMALAAQRIEKEGFFGVDLNFGCCAAAICKKGSGAALLKDPKLARQIVEAVRKNVSIPLFVKFRIGWETNPLDAAIDAAQMAVMFEEAGADALVFHPRTAPDRRLRPPKWDYISKIKEAVSIPVFGNGNIFEASDCEKMLNMSGCDGISIGRMAVARPWIFASLTCGFSPDPDIYRRTAIRMITLLIKHQDERTAVKMFKKFVPYYAAGFKFGHSISKQMLKPDTPDGILKAIDGIFLSSGEPPETVDRPNLHLFL